MVTIRPAGMPDSLDEAFRSAMARVCTPVSVVTTLDDGRPHGTTVSAFASLSIVPPMVLVSLDTRSDLLALVRRTQRFGLNVLSSGQTELAIGFARKGADKFEGVDWHAELGVARLADVAAWAVCRVARIVEGGDHRILLGEVVLAEAADAGPLTYHARAFGTHRDVVETLR